MGGRVGGRVIKGTIGRAFGARLEVERRRHEEGLVAIERFAQLGLSRLLERVGDLHVVAHDLEARAHHGRASPQAERRGCEQREHCGDVEGCAARDSSITKALS